MNKKLISILIANLFVAAPVFAQSNFGLSGSVSVGGIHADDKDATDASKLNEFRDLSNGGTLGFDLMGRGTRYWLDLFGENLGRDDHYVSLRGGMYDVFKYRLYSDQLKHNFLFGGRTPYANAGSTNVTATLPSTNPATWNSVDIGYKRRDDGGFFEFQGASPWYFRVDGNQVTQSGTKLGAASGGMSPGNGQADLLFPTEYTTRNATVEGGYSSKTMHFALSWMTSKFETDDDVVDWTNGYFKGTDRTYLAGDNKYSRLAGNATIRKLPLNSTLALRFTNDELTSDQTLGTTVLGAAGASLTTLPNVPTFNGKVEHKTYTLALASAPMRNLDTRLYVNRWKRDDKSTHLVFTGTASSGTPYTNEPLSIDKDNWGFDAFYRLNRQNRVGVGYDYLDLERERHDFDKTKDKKWFVEWKTSMVDNVSARVKYTDLKRTANFLHANDGVDSGDVLYWNRFLRAYDATDADQKSWKATVDFTPAEFLDVSIEGTTRENKYKDVVLGRLKDTRSELYASVSYGNPETARWTVFGDVENVKYDSRHRVVGSGTAPGAYDPATAPTSSNYNWEGTAKDKNWAFGVALDLPATEKLMVKASVVYYKSDGSLDFVAAPTIAAASYPQPVSNYDDAKRTSFNLKGIYKWSKAITLTAGYAYEKYDFKDVQIDGFQYVIPGNGGADSYFMGYLANPQYKASILYGMLTWNF
ncbi:MAG TPA: MtrB/PioB family outer membrane beta-barrel protein [Usitatibacteraceae bacterium]|nr:MtrB/PioB family outer membrane beta-barrel protein [Usitatibacteraceae bacterium]